MIRVPLALLLAGALSACSTIERDPCGSAKLAVAAAEISLAGAQDALTVANDAEHQKAVAIAQSGLRTTQNLVLLFCQTPTVTAQAQ